MCKYVFIPEEMYVVHVCEIDMIGMVLQSAIPGKTVWHFKVFLIGLSFVSTR